RSSPPAWWHYASVSNCQPQRHHKYLEAGVAQDPASSLRSRRANADLMISPHADIFDRACQRQRRVRAAALGPSTFLVDRVVADLSDRLAAGLRRFEHWPCPSPPAHARPPAA